MNVFKTLTLSFGLKTIVFDKYPGIWQTNLVSPVPIQSSKRAKVVPSVFPLMIYIHYYLLTHQEFLHSLLGVLSTINLCKLIIIKIF